MKKKQKDKLTALVLDPQDNVATLLEDVCANAVIVLKGIEGYIHISENIAIGHKVALKRVNESQSIIKYGHRIGIATRDINPGEWVHIHNISSAVDTSLKKRIEI